jgi:[acyl-carrier-protein] S-malonyltransferase
MKPAAERMAALLAETAFAAPTVPVLHNADVRSYKDAAAIRDALVRQLYSPVRWVETVREMAAQGTQLMIEFGPGKVLAGLGKRIDRELAAVCVQDTASLEEALAAQRDAV